MRHHDIVINYQHTAYPHITTLQPRATFFHHTLCISSCRALVAAEAQLAAGMNAHAEELRLLQERLAAACVEEEEEQDYNDENEQCHEALHVI